MYVLNHLFDGPVPCTRQLVEWTGPAYVLDKRSIGWYRVPSTQQASGIWAYQPNYSRYSTEFSNTTTSHTGDRKHEFLNSWLLCTQSCNLRYWLSPEYTDKEPSEWTGLYYQRLSCSLHSPSSEWAASSEWFRICIMLSISVDFPSQAPTFTHIYLFNARRSMPILFWASESYYCFQLLVSPCTSLA